MGRRCPGLSQSLPAPPKPAETFKEMKKSVWSGYIWASRLSRSPENPSVQNTLWVSIGCRQPENFLSARAGETEARTQMGTWPHLAK